MKRLGIALLAGLVMVTAAEAADEPAAPSQQPASTAWPAKIPNLTDRYFLGYETEPAMDAYARMLISTEAGLSRFVGTLLPSRRFAPLYELLSPWSWTPSPTSGVDTDRGREFGLDPTFGFAYTSLKKDPETNLQLIMIGTGGTEESSSCPIESSRTSTMGRGRRLQDRPAPLCQDRPQHVRGADARPASHPEDFQDEYENGNDIALTITSRQAHRRQADPARRVGGRVRCRCCRPHPQDNYRDVAPPRSGT